MPRSDRDTLLDQIGARSDNNATDFQTAVGLLTTLVHKPESARGPVKSLHRLEPRARQLYLRAADNGCLDYQLIVLVVDTMLDPAHAPNLIGRLEAKLDHHFHSRRFSRSAPRGCAAAA